MPLIAVVVRTHEDFGEPLPSYLDDMVDKIDCVSGVLDDLSPVPPIADYLDELETAADDCWNQTGGPYSAGGCELRVSASECEDSVAVDDSGWTPNLGISCPIYKNGEIDAWVSVYVEGESAQAIYPSCTFSYENDVDESAVGVVLHMAETRTDLLGAEIVDKCTDTPYAIPGHDDRRLFFGWAGTVCARDQVCVQVRFRGDPPAADDVTWLLPPGSADVAMREGGCAPSAVAIDKATSLAAMPQPGIGDLLKGRAKRLNDPATDPLVVAADRLFLSIEQDTHPQVLGADAKRAIRTVSALLFHRARGRAKAAIAGETFTPPAWIDRPNRVSDRELVYRLASEMRVRMVTAANQQNLTTDVVDYLRLAFEAFTGGKLSYQGTTSGAPNGVNYFGFVELAIAAIELGEEPSFWKSVLPVLTASAQIFVDCYHMAGAKRTSCAYGVAFYDGSRFPNDADLKVLRTRHQNDPEGEYALLLAAALADEYFA